jgi:ubiquinone/menaquinone biosynthesis C-methylase UbiE
MNAKDYFDNSADTWDERFLTPKLASFLENFVLQFGITSGRHVLDVGTGTGVLVPYLSKAVGPRGSVVAIDFSEKMLNQCKTNHSHLKNVSMKVGAIEDVTFSPESFDAVICFGVFPHLANKQKALHNIHCMLKAEGKLVIAHALSSEELKIHHKNVSAKMAHATLPKEADMKKLLEKTGFTKISIKDEPGQYLCITTKA